MANDVESYYNDNTRRFIRFGKGGTTGIIHRAVWAPGVTSQAGAMHYVHDVIGEELESRGVCSPDDIILDLGCGVGASMAYLAARNPARFSGVTLSPVQAAIAAERHPEVTVTVGDFGNEGVVRTAAGLHNVTSTTNAPARASDPPCAAGAYMIESLCHAPDAERVLANAARVIRPGGVLIVCDDFAADDARSPAAELAASTYQAGWHVRTFQSVNRLVDRAAKAGFAHATLHDLTPYIANGRLRDWAVRILMGLAGWLPVRGAGWENMVGGNALQTLYRIGAARYSVVVFTREDP